MFEPDEFIYSKVVNFLKRRKKQAQETLEHAVKLNDIKQRLTIFSRAITGEAIEIFEAEREGGYKNNSFFLPSRYAEFQTLEQNTKFYIFRIVYLSVQKNLNLNSTSGQEFTLEYAREKAQETSTLVLNEMFNQFPMTKHIHQELISHYFKIATDKKPEDLSFVYGKWMKNDPKTLKKAVLKNISEQVKQAIDHEINTILKANAVEEITSLEIDKKQQEDYVMTHNFEKIETAEEWEGGWRDFNGDDELDDHANALEDFNMKHTVRVDDPIHSIYQAEFIDNTTISESAELNTEAPHITYDEWDFSKREYKRKFCKVYPKTQQETDTAYYKNTLQKNASTLTGLRKMLTSVNNKYQQQRRQTQGEDFDLDAITDLYVDVHSRHTPSEKIYLSKRKKDKDLSILILLDVSLSSDGYAGGNKVIDVEKQVSIIFGEILNEFNVDFSIQSFYSKTRNYATYLSLKGFDDTWDKRSEERRVG